MMLRKLIYCILTVLLFGTNGCKKTHQQDVSTPRTFDEIIKNGGTMAEPSASETVSQSSTADSTIGGYGWVCTRETKDIKAKGGGSDGFPLFSPNAGIIFPGSLLQGKSLGSATPDPIAVKRAGGIISTDILDGNQYASIAVPEIGKGAVTQAINDIISRSTGIVPANFSFNYSSIQSREEFALHLGVDVSTAFTEIESSLNLDFSKSVNRYFVQLEQSFYTMSFDMPTGYEDIFAPEVTPADLAKYVGPGNPACYISDVTYGRIFYMVIESTSSQTEMDLAISGAFNGVGVSVDGNLAIEQMKKLKNLHISVFAFGGTSESTFDAIGLTNISELKAVLGEAADIRSGKALSYVVKTVYDNKIVSTQLATKYDVVNCIPAANPDAPALSRHWSGLSSKLGIIGAAFIDHENKIYLINTAGDQYMVSELGKLEGPFPVTNLGTGTMPFSKIGAACNIEGNLWPSPTIMFFDESGTRYTYLLGAPGVSWNDDYSIYTYSDGNCPFNSNGVGAMFFYDKDPMGPSIRYFVNVDGTKAVQYKNNPKTWYGVTGFNTNLLGFEKVGAAIGMELGDDHFIYYFDKESPQYSVSGNHTGNGITTIGPFLY